MACQSWRPLPSLMKWKCPLALTQFGGRSSFECPLQCYAPRKRGLTPGPHHLDSRFRGNDCVVGLPTSGNRRQCHSRESESATFANGARRAHYHREASPPATSFPRKRESITIGKP